MMFRSDSDYPDVHPVALDGERVRLREVAIGDAPAASRWGTDPEFFRHLAVAPVADEAEEAAFLARLVGLAHERPRRHYHLGVEWNESGELVGMVRLSISAPEHRGADIGYGLRRDCWGRGIATEAASLLLDFGFRALGLHRVFAYHHPENVASGNVMQKLGMQREGRLRQNVLAYDGRWRDSVVYGILEQEWRGR